jgi:hypothetical protein
MTEDRLDRLLKGYRLPDVPPGLDRRVLEEADRILFFPRMRTASLDAVRVVLGALGFGYLTWLFDLISASGAEYRVDIL